ncbi:hypothetical protein [Lysinibacillus sp. C5.1]
MPFSITFLFWKNLSVGELVEMHRKISRLANIIVEKSKFSSISN